MWEPNEGDEIQTIIAKNHRHILPKFVTGSVSDGHGGTKNTQGKRVYQ
jgi:hypothetical protein